MNTMVLLSTLMRLMKRINKIFNFIQKFKIEYIKRSKMQKKTIVLIITLIMNLTCYGINKVHNMTLRNRVNLEINLKNKLKQKGHDIINHIENSNIIELKKEISPLVIYENKWLIKDIGFFKKVFTINPPKFYDIQYYNTNIDEKDKKNIIDAGISLKFNYLSNEQASLVYKVTDKNNNCYLFTITLGKYYDHWKLEELSFDLYSTKGMEQQDFYLLGKQLVESNKFITGTIYLSAMFDLLKMNKKISYLHNRGHFINAKKLIHDTLEKKSLKKVIDKFQIISIKGSLVMHRVMPIIEYINLNLKTDRESNIEDCKLIIKEISKQDKDFTKHFDKIVFRITKESPKINKESQYVDILFDINELKIKK